MKTSISEFGKMPGGETVSLYTLENENGMKAVISDLGGDLVRLCAPDKSGGFRDVVLGYDGFEGYSKNFNFFGAIVGRNANRIRGAEVEIAGKTYQLLKNNGEHNLHSGRGNMTFRIFNAELAENGGASSLVLTLRQADMSDGFPGNLDVKVTYTLTPDNALSIDYFAVSDADTVINMTNHSYFNMAGHESGSVDAQILTMDSAFFTPNDKSCMPTGEILSVEGTPFDFRDGRAFGDGFASGFEQIDMFKGYDHNFVLSGRGYRRFAVVRDPDGGCEMEAWTDLPGVQIFTANGMKRQGKDGAEYSAHQGFCLETQTFPGADKMPWLISPYYKAGEEYKTRTAFKFL